MKIKTTKVRINGQTFRTHKNKLESDELDVLATNGLFLNFSMPAYNSSFLGFN